MQRWIVWAAVMLVVPVVPVALAGPAPDSRAGRYLAAKRQRALAAVSAASRAAGDAYAKAIAADDTGDVIASVTHYRDAANLAPNVDHTHRSLCLALLVPLLRLDEAIPECERALQLAPDSPWDKTALADVLVHRGRPGDAARAQQLAGDAVTADPQDLDALIVAAQIAYAQNNAEDLDLYAKLLLTADPDGMQANHAAALADYRRGHWLLADQHLAAAKAAGLDQKTFDELSVEIYEANQKAVAAEPAPATASGPAPRWPWIAGGAAIGIGIGVWRRRRRRQPSSAK